MNKTGTLEVTSRLVAWKIDAVTNTLESGINIISEEFMMGNWYWHLTFEEKQLQFGLVPNDKSPSTQSRSLPIASLVFSLVYNFKGMTSILRREFTDRLMPYSKDSKIMSTRAGPLPKSAKLTISVISVEFLDLKMRPTTDGICFSIWGDEYLQQNSLNNPLSRMFSESICTDVVITTMDGSIETHRAVLAVNSPVFKAMFSNNYKEHETSTINITDMTIEACRAMVNFMYGKRRFNEIREHATELAVAADKYQIIDLKRVCEACLCENVGAKNVFDSLKFASVLGLRNLKSTCLFYLAKMGIVYDLQDDYNSFLREADRDLIIDVSNACLNPWKKISGTENK